MSFSALLLHTGLVQVGYRLYRRDGAGNGGAMFEYLSQFYPVMIFCSCVPTVVLEAAQI